MNEYKIVTCCSRFPVADYYCLREFVTSLKSDTNNILALNESMGKWGGLGTKPKWVYRAIKDKLIDTKYMIFCDCFDFVFAEEPSVLFYEYLKFEAPIVISAEKNCFPTDLKDEYDNLLTESISPYKYLNSGLIVGETEAILTCLEEMDAMNIPDDYWDIDKAIQVNPNDQFYWQQTFLKQPVDIVLDREQQLCNTLHDVKEDELQFLADGYIKNVVTETYPCSFHFNGGAKTGGLMQPILKHLNLL